MILNIHSNILQQWRIYLWTLRSYNLKKKLRLVSTNWWFVEKRCCYALDWARKRLAPTGSVVYTNPHVVNSAAFYWGWGIKRQLLIKLVWKARVLPVHFLCNLCSMRLLFFARGGSCIVADKPFVSTQCFQTARFQKDFSLNL